MPGQRCSSTFQRNRWRSSISSAEGKGKLAFFIRDGGFLSGFATPLALLAAGVMLGYGVNRWLRSR